MKSFFCFFTLFIMAISTLSFADSKTIYTGEKITINFYEAGIKNVFQTLKGVSGKNFAIDKDVTGKVTMFLETPVPWNQVLDLVLKMNRLGKVVEGDVIRIATATTLKKEKEDGVEVESTEPLITEYISINYSDAKKDIKPRIEEILTTRGRVRADLRNNIIILTATLENIKKAKEIIKNLDKTTPQVIIEAKIVEASTNFLRELGIKWDAEVSNNKVFDGISDCNMAMNVPTLETVSSIGINFTKFAGTPFLLNAKLMAMESRSEGKIVSSPKIITLNNKEAIIRQGLRYPYKVFNEETGIATTKFENIDLVLKVLPHITSDNRISLSIDITKADLGAYYPGGQSFTTKGAETKILVNNKDTFVIGGIIKTAENSKVTGTPWLSKIPGLGWLFKSTNKTGTEEELLIFITPTILRLEQI